MSDSIPSERQAQDAVVSSAGSRLADLVGALRTDGHLIEINRQVDPVCEMAAHVEQSDGWPILFHKVGGARFPIFYNLFGNADWVARRLGTAPSGIVRALIAACEHPTAPRLVPSRHDVIADGPLDLARWLAIGQDYSRAPVPYLNAGVIFVRDPETGFINASMHSLNLVAPNRLVVHVQAEHFAHIYGRWHRRGEPMPIAVAIGMDPAVWLGCAMAVEHPPSEMEVAGGLAGPVPVSRCSTVDLEVPAASEIVLEGRVVLNEHGAGGPETLPSRLYSASYKGPVAEIHRVTAFSDAIAHGLLNGGRDHLNVMHWLKEFQIARHLRSIGFESKVRAVKVNPGGCDWMYAAIALEREHAGEARALIESLLNAKLALGGLRRVVIVDTDIDIGDPRAVDWAIATRMRPERDLLIVEASRIRGPDPAARGGPLAKLGMDATMPAGQEAAYALPTVDWPGPLDLPAKLPPMPPAVAQLLMP